MLLEPKRIPERVSVCVCVCVCVCARARVFMKVVYLATLLVSSL